MLVNNARDRLTRGDTTVLDVSNEHFGKIAAQTLDNV